MTEVSGPEKEGDPYADIRPYSNLEAPMVLRRLARDQELAKTIAIWRLPRLRRLLPAAAYWLSRLWLLLVGRRLASVEDLQNLIAPNLAKMIKKTSRFSVAGIDALDVTRSRVYVGNHRDIVMDAAYANYALHRAGVKTLAIAIGDNLLSKPWVADLMRLNKSFVVKRNLSGPRALLAAAKQLSGYIRDSVSQDLNSIWIAHREGRAKDGRDVTERAVIKMLAMSRGQGETPQAVLEELDILPLIISYELDPCDALKAAELSAGKGYVKSEFEDVTSIARGITGEKGCVHLQFGDALAPGLSVEEVAAEIDAQMVIYYRLYATNVWAWEWLHGESAPAEITYHRGSVSETAFRSRLDAVPEAHRDWMLRMYANPVIRAIEQSATDRGVQCD